jgi:hypothetical protein
MRSLRATLHLFDHRGLSVADRDHLLERIAELEAKNARLVSLLKRMQARRQTRDPKVSEARH